MNEAPVERSTMRERILWSDPSGARLRWRYRFIWAPVFAGLGLFNLGAALVQYRWLSPLVLVALIAAGLVAIAIGYALFAAGRPNRS